MKVLTLKDGRFGVLDTVARSSTGTLLLASPLAAHMRLISSYQRLLQHPQTEPGSSPDMRKVHMLREAQSKLK